MCLEEPLKWYEIKKILCSSCHMNAHVLVPWLSLFSWIDFTSVPFWWSADCQGSWGELAELNVRRSELVFFVFFVRSDTRDESMEVESHRPRYTPIPFFTTVSVFAARGRSRGRRWWRRKKWRRVRAPQRNAIFEVECGGHSLYY